MARKAYQPKRRSNSNQNQQRSDSLKKNKQDNLRSKSAGIQQGNERNKKEIQDQRNKASTKKKRESSGEKYESARDKVIRRFRPGDNALKQLRQYNQTPSLLIRKLPFQRLIREISTRMTEEDYLRWTSFALVLLQTVVEDYMVSFFEDANACALHAKRVTLMSKDLALAARIRGQKNVTGIFIPTKK
ncbi:hypothetical protein ABPG72_000011 [Tetrahymena utriculariae]